jgi:hypothetical protein
MKARALQCLATFAERRGDLEKAAYYTQRLEQRKQETKETKALPNHLPDDVF